ncbi:MAG TPA: hypothetical protein VE173_09585, partial [Longimicrobiales bacterium]|nr:hypothetical protein [Longimicrobiales bacterium]
PSRRNLITAEDIRGLDVQTAYELVQRLQPQWLTSRGPTSLTNAAPTVASVYLDSVEVGDIEYLKGLNVTAIREMRYYAPGEASVRFGMGHQRGVIDVITERGSGGSP